MIFDWRILGGGCIRGLLIVIARVLVFAYSALPVVTWRPLFEFPTLELRFYRYACENCRWCRSPTCFFTPLYLIFYCYRFVLTKISLLPSSLRYLVGDAFLSRITTDLTCTVSRTAPRGVCIWLLLGTNFYPAMPFPSSSNSISGGVPLVLFS